MAEKVRGIRKMIDLFGERIQPRNQNSCIQAGQCYAYIKGLLK